MKIKLLLCLLFSTAAFSQVPRPFVYGGLDLGDSAAAIAGAGLIENSEHFLFNGEAAYDTDGKSNDNANITHNGHNRRFKGTAYYRTTSGWFVGGGASWARLYTIAYTKEQWHVLIGGGKDFISPFFSTRIQMDYVTPFGAEHVNRSGCTIPKGQCTNNVQGPAFSIFFPSPATKGHVFARFLIAGYGAHMTVTSSDPVLTAKQKSQFVALSETQMTIMYRF